MGSVCYCGLPYRLFGAMSYNRNQGRFHSHNIPGLPIFTTRAMQKRAAEISSKQYVIPNETGNALHTTWFINDKGDKVWLKFDASRPCVQFQTNETRFYKPKLHTIRSDPYTKKPRDVISSNSFDKDSICYTELL